MVAKEKKDFHDFTKKYGVSSEKLGFWMEADYPDNSTGEVVDTSSYAKNLMQGTGSAQPTLELDGKGKVFTFDGIDDLVSISSANHLETTEVTVGCWIKWNGTTGDHQVFGARWYQGSSASYARWTLEMSPTGQFQFATHASTGQYVALAGSFLSTGQWYFLAGTCKSNTFKRIYIDGEVDNNDESFSYDIYTGTDIPFLIAGHDRTTDRNYFKGSIANFFVFKRALFNAEIKRIYLKSHQFFGHSL